MTMSPINHLRQRVLPLFLFWVCIAGVNLNAQDIIIKKDGEQIKVKILEIGDKEIKFKYFEAEDGPTISIRRDEIKTYKLKSKTGYIATNVTEDPMAVSNDRIRDKTSALKFEFFSPLQQNIAIGYEWMYRPGINFEAGGGIIGPGVGSRERERVLFREEDIQPGGFFVRAGVKLLLGSTSDFVVEGIKYAHPLKGRYIKPEVAYSSFTRKSKVIAFAAFGGNDTVKLTRSYESLAINIIYGRQLILGNSVTAGYYIGAGYGFENVSSNADIKNYWNTQRYSHRFFSKDLPFTYVFGFNVGIILKAPGGPTKSVDNNKYHINKKSVEQIEKKID